MHKISIHRFSLHGFMHPPRRMLVSAFLCLITSIIVFRYKSPLSRWARSVVGKDPARQALAVPANTSLSNFGTSSTPLSNNMTRTPVYFLSHGGPNIMESFDHPAYNKLQEIGREITQKVKPKGVVVFSAHWQAERSSIHVNTAEITELIYE